MNCQNCGAAMRLVPDRNYFYCEHCTSFYFPPESAEGVRVLGELSDLECPVCHAPMVSASVAGAGVLHCHNCRGLFMKQGAFAFVVSYLRARTRDTPGQPRPLNRAHLQRKVLCPTCGSLMDTFPYHGPGNVVIDVCPRCAVIWLDYGELTLIAEAPGRDRRRA